MFAIALLVGTAFTGWAGTISLERLAPRLGLVQPPNARSSHINPTPRGGGVVIAGVAVLSATLLMILSGPDLWTVAVATIIVAALGFADDLADLPVGWRLLVQLTTFIFLLWSAPELPGIALPFAITLGGPMLPILILITGLWWLNLFNFMDGIDGLAGSQAALLLSGACLIWWSIDPTATTHPVFLLTLATIGATAGFLIRNWPPARIFMGDAGSNALALLIFAIALSTIASGAMSYPTWLILPSLFVTDATITLLRRMSRGERPWRAHRRHAYQQLSRRWSHRSVTILYCGFTLLWAIPLAFVAQYLPGLAWPLVLVAYAPLIAFMLWADAGGADEVPART